MVHVIDGIMIIQQRGQAPVALTAGESMACPPGEWHWHGSDPTYFFTQIAVIEVDQDGQDADWGEPVAEEHYRSSAATALALRPAASQA